MSVVSITTNSVSPVDALASRRRLRFGLSWSRPCAAAFTSTSVASEAIFCTASFSASEISDNAASPTGVESVVVAMATSLSVLESRLRDEVLLPGRQVYRLQWVSGVTLQGGQALPPELLGLGASFESLAVFDPSEGVVFDTVLSVPVLDVTGMLSSLLHIYLPLVLRRY